MFNVLFNCLFALCIGAMLLLGGVSVFLLFFSILGDIAFPDLPQQLWMREGLTCSYWRTEVGCWNWLIHLSAKGFFITLGLAVPAFVFGMLCWLTEPKVSTDP